MNIIIACVIGGGSLAGGRGNNVGALFGTMSLALLNNFFNLFEINQHVQSDARPGAAGGGCHGRLPQSPETAHARKE